MRRPGGCGRWPDPCRRSRRRPPRRWSRTTPSPRSGPAWHDRVDRHVGRRGVSSLSHRGHRHARPLSEAPAMSQMRGDPIQTITLRRCSTPSRAWRSPPSDRASTRRPQARTAAAFAIRGDARHRKGASPNGSSSLLWSRTTEHFVAGRGARHERACDRLDRLVPVGGNPGSSRSSATVRARSGSSAIGRETLAERLDVDDRPSSLTVKSSRCRRVIGCPCRQPPRHRPRRGRRWALPAAPPPGSSGRARRRGRAQSPGASQTPAGSMRPVTLERDPRQLKRLRDDCTRGRIDAVLRQVVPGRPADVSASESAASTPPAGTQT